MAISVDAARFNITVDSSKATPSFDDTGSRFIGHLKEGWDGTNFSGDALTATGSVPVTLASGDDFKLGFVQFAKGVTWQAFYAGRTPKEGSIVLDFFLPPAMTTILLLDGSNAKLPPPFYRSP